MIAILLVVLLVIIDLTQFRGYYIGQLSLTMERAIDYLRRYRHLHSVCGRVRFTSRRPSNSRANSIASALLL
jgi:hypothetical protein